MAVMSMTGFGAATFTIDGLAYRVEARSVNHKGLALRLHLPPELAHAEGAVGQSARAALGRGAVDVTVLREGGVTPTRLEVDHAGLGALMRELTAVAAECGAAPPTLDTALRLGAFVRVVEHRPDPAESESALTTALALALDALVAMRKREGESLRADTEGRLDALARLLDRIEVDAPRLLAQMEERLRQKVADALARHGHAIDDARVLTEVVVLSDKADVTEEIVRARHHIAAFRQALADPDLEVGRRLDFLVQELLREWNTLGSKCRDADIAQRVVDAKVELEKIREQVQNIA
ncbi:MAG: YicC family protein [Deltaproteobacteria bacterium]|nr:YicC family protein [Deltaproteobacteria bacterium]